MEERYSRHLPLIEEGFGKLTESAVLIAGAGGLGSNLAFQLLALGVRNMAVVDLDVVSESDLNRCLHYTPADVGRKKVEVLRDRLMEFDPGSRVVSVDSDVREMEPLEEYDVFVDCLDNPESRKALERLAGMSGRPLVHGAIEGLRGQVASYPPGEISLMGELYVSGLGGPVEVLPQTALLASSLMANEVMHILLGRRPPLWRKILLFDLSVPAFEEVELG